MRKSGVSERRIGACSYTMDVLIPRPRQGILYYGKFESLEALANPFPCHFPETLKWKHSVNLWEVEPTALPKKKTGK